MKYYFFFGLIILFVQMTCTHEFKLSIENQLNQMLKEISKKSKLILENKRIKIQIRVKN